MNKKRKDVVAISACLVGIPCRYDGKSKLDKNAILVFVSNKSIAICPEILGGLAIPRPACEIVGGDGNDVLNGRAKVVDKKGNDYTKEFINGARVALGIIKKLGIKKVYLKSKSPSCGLYKIHSGGFTGEIKNGSGVFAALLKREDIDLEEI